MKKYLNLNVFSAAIQRLESLYNAGHRVVVSFSGGKDSTTQAVIAREELGLHCLLVNGEPEGLTELGRHNIENLKQLGFDVISMRPNPKLMKKLIKWDFYNHLNPVKATEFSLWASTYIIAEKFRVPLIIQGENPGLTLGARLTGVGTDGNALKAEMLQTLSTQYFLNDLGSIWISISGGPAAGLRADLARNRNFKGGGFNRGGG